MTTNYEKIKNMTVDEMTNFLDMYSSCSCCVDDNLIECNEARGCWEGKKQWLLSEVEND